MVEIILVVSVSGIFGVAIYGIRLLINSGKDLTIQRSAFVAAKEECDGVEFYGQKLYWNVAENTVVGRWFKICQQRVTRNLSTPLEMLQELTDTVLEKSDSVIKAVISSLTVLGLLGTFIGLVVAISKTSNAVQEIQRSSHQLSVRSEGETTIGEEVQKQFDTFLEKLKPVLSGMSLAFITSIVGLTCSLTLGYFFARYSRDREEFRAELMQFADEVFLPIFTPKPEKHTIGELILQNNEIIQDAFKEIQKKFDDTNKESREHLDKALEETGRQNKDALNEVSVYIKTALDEVINRLTRNEVERRSFFSELMSQNAQRNAEESQKILASFGDVTEVFKTTADELKNNLDVLESLGKKIDGSAAKILESAQVFSHYVENIEKFSKPIEELDEIVDELITIFQQNDPKSRYNRQVFENILTALEGLSMQVDGFRGVVEKGGEKSYSIASNISGEVTLVKEGISGMHTDVSGKITKTTDEISEMCTGVSALLASEDESLKSIDHQFPVITRMQGQLDELNQVLKEMYTQMINQLQGISEAIAGTKLNAEGHPTFIGQPSGNLEELLIELNLSINALAKASMRRSEPITLRRLPGAIKNFFIG